MSESLARALVAAAEASPMKCSSDKAAWAHRKGAVRWASRHLPGIWDAEQCGECHYWHLLKLAKVAERL